MNTLQDLQPTSNYTVSADYLNRRLLEAARKNLVAAQDKFHEQRVAGKDTTFAQQLLYQAYDRVWEAQMIASGVFG